MKDNHARQQARAAVRDAPTLTDAQLSAELHERAWAYAPLGDWFPAAVLKALEAKNREIEDLKAQLAAEVYTEAAQVVALLPMAGGLKVVPAGVKSKVA